MNSASDLRYKPKGFWCKYDFEINRVYWESVGFDLAYSTRLANLKDLCSVLSCLHIAYWIFGKTLWGAVKSGRLVNDHDDDIGVFLKDRSIISLKAIKSLEAKGFKVIRDTEGIISIERDYRYIDVCMFSKKGSKKIGYNRKSVDYSFFTDFETVLIDGVEFPAPRNPAILVDKLYPPATLASCCLAPLGSFTARGAIRKFRGLPDRIKNKHVSLVENIQNPWRRFLGLLAPLSGFSIRTLTLKEFMDLYIEPAESFNWRWRYRHLSLVTNDRNLSQLHDIIKHLSSQEKRNMIDRCVQESDTSHQFHYKSNFDMRFWWSGNNYFWYCVKYEYRAGVVPYSNANAYICSGQKPLLYTSEYYESLPELNDAEISNLLNQKPIVIKNGCVVSGKHRVFAMIGRLSGGKSYIPLRVIDMR